MEWLSIASDIRSIYLFLFFISGGKHYITSYDVVI